MLVQNKGRAVESFTFEVDGKTRLIEVVGGMEMWLEVNPGEESGGFWLVGYVAGKELARYNLRYVGSIFWK